MSNLIGRLTIPTGSIVSFQSTDTHVQWKTDNGAWVDLFELGLGGGRWCYAYL